MELLDALDATFDHTGGVIAEIRPNQLEAPTPCAEWDVQALLAHTIGVVTNMGRGVLGESLLLDPNATAVEPDPGAQFGAVAATTLAAWRSLAPDASVDIGAGPMPAMVAMSINLLDTATHSWDIATATGQSGDLDPEVATRVMEACRMVVSDEVRGFAGFDPEVPVPAGSSVIEQVVAFLGRRPVLA
ncbi:MAG: TIGR03086 family metal-binding protein [Acidimicrobiia bacterium]